MRSLLLLITIFSIHYSHGQYRPFRFFEPLEYQWRWPAERSELWNAYPDEGMVSLKQTVIHVLGNIKNELNQEIGFAREVHTVNKIHFRTYEAIHQFLDETVYLSPYYTLLAYDGRIIHENGEVTDLSSHELRSAIVEVPHRNEYLGELYKEGISLMPGDQLEIVLSYRIWAFSLLLEQHVHAAYPIKEKVLIVKSDNEFVMPYFHMLPSRKRSGIEVFTYNDWPAGQVHEDRNTITRSWTFTDLAPLPSSPYRVLKSEYPFFTIGVMGHAPPYMLINDFDRRYPYVRYSGRRNSQAFVNHLEARKRALKGRPVIDLIRDVVTFVSDSITMVPDEEMAPATPIGCHFHDRILSPEQTIVLYRQLMSVLDIPLYVCFTRDRYQGAIVLDTAYAEQLDTHLLAFHDPATKRLHYLVPRTLTEDHLLDECRTGYSDKKRS